MAKKPTTPAASEVPEKDPVTDVNVGTPKTDPFAEFYSGSGVPPESGVEPPSPDVTPAPSSTPASASAAPSVVTPLPEVSGDTSTENLTRIIEGNSDVQAEAAIADANVSAGGNEVYDPKMAGEAVQQQKDALAVNNANATLAEEREAREEAEQPSGGPEPGNDEPAPSEVVPEPEPVDFEARMRKMEGLVAGFTQMDENTGEELRKMASRIEKLESNTTDDGATYYTRGDVEKIVDDRVAQLRRQMTDNDKVLRVRDTGKRESAEVAGIDPLSGKPYNSLQQPTMKGSIDDLPRVAD